MGMGTLPSLKNRFAMHFHMASEFQVCERHGWFIDDNRMAMFVKDLLKRFKPEQIKEGVDKGYLAHHQFRETCGTIRNVVIYRDYRCAQRGYKRVFETVIRACEALRKQGARLRAALRRPERDETS